ncbi:hypothetical protein CLU79DRAFT_780372 [Phycomyces nitens]|nr:hypothetical protein CLU79DRAFT_780372 [Phycomyces nitens]
MVWISPFGTSLTVGLYPSLILVTLTVGLCPWVGFHPLEPTWQWVITLPWFQSP